MAHPDLFIELEHKRLGMTRAAKSNASILGIFREIAAELGRRNRLVTIDDVRSEVEKRGIAYTSGNWLGSTFKGSAWKFSGQFVESTHEGSHGRMIRVWEYVS